MSGKSNIEWTGFTWNPLAGCSVLTPGCKRCYAMRLAKRLGAMGNPLYKGLTQDTNAGAVWTGEMRKAPHHTLIEPLRRRKPTTYFVNSMSDLFHENVPDEWIDEIFAVMALAPQHTFQVLTKRAARMRDYLMARNGMGNSALCRAINNIPAGMGNRKGALEMPLPNVWLGVSTERQQEADERIPELLLTPAAVRFISAEPLLGPIRLDRLTREESHAAFIDDALTGFVSNGCGGTHREKLDWVIVGGESGNGYRDMPPEWARSLRDQCLAAGVSVFIKQMAGKKPIPDDLLVRQFPPGLRGSAATT